MISPLPSPAVEPVRARPSAARFAMRVRVWACSGASVPTITIHEPSACGRSGMQVGDTAPHRHTGNRQLASRSEVRHHQHADGERASRTVDDARGAADAALEAEERHAGAAADAALLHWVATCRVERIPDILLGQREGQVVVQEAIVALGDHADRNLLARLLRIAPRQVACRGV